MPDLEKLLENSQKEEQFFLDAHQKVITFYSTLITAVLSATIAGVATAPKERPECYIFLLAGPLMAIALAEIAKRGTSRFYRRFLEAVTMCAKLEQALGLTKRNVMAPNKDDYWPFEQLIPDRWLKSRKGISVSTRGTWLENNCPFVRCCRLNGVGGEEVYSSENFIKHYMDLGYQHITWKLLMTVEIISVFLFIVLLLLCLCKFEAFCALCSLW